jgi:8-oxo-dGTP pyrophosphatase MutT (NUDIX family)
MDETAAQARERASVVCVHAARLLCVRLRDPTSRIARWFVPGGAIEPGETAEQAAVRETREETGYEIALRPSPPHVAQYRFVWQGRSFAVITHFFAAQLLDPARSPAPVSDASYHEGVTWLTFEEVAREFAFLPEMLHAFELLSGRARQIL